MGDRSVRTRWLLASFLVAAIHSPTPQADAAPRIVLTRFSIEPTTLKLGESFTIRAKAEATGVPLGSFLLRTAEDVPKNQTLPGFPLHANGKWYMAEKGKYHLFDNGTVDEDPEKGTFVVRISTKGWKEGVTRFAFFASRRPDAGPFVAARHDFAVAVRGNQVLVEDLGGSNVNASRAIQSFEVTPTIVNAGETVRLSAGISSGKYKGIRITNPFCIAADDTLPGFTYNPEKKKLALEGDFDKPTETLDFNLSTEDWPVGAHHFLFELIGFSGNAIDHRSFAITIPDPRDRLDVSVEDSSEFMPGTHFGRFLKLQNGTLFCEDKVSTDQGRTWQSGTHNFGVGGEQLSDRTVIGLAYRCLPTEKDDGWYLCDRSILNDDGRTFRKDQARFFVPEAKPAMGHGPHKGPLFMRSIIERKRRLPRRPHGRLVQERHGPLPLRPRPPLLPHLRLRVHRSRPNLAIPHHHRLRPDRQRRLQRRLHAAPTQRRVARRPPHRQRERR